MVDSVIFLTSFLFSSIILVIYWYITNHLKIKWYKTASIYYFIISLGQEFKNSLLGVPGSKISHVVVFKPLGGRGVCCSLIQKLDWVDGRGKKTQGRRYVYPTNSSDACCQTSFLHFMGPSTRLPQDSVVDFSQGDVRASKGL